MNPSANSAIIDAVHWWRDVLLGSVGTAVAVLAVSVLGVLMFTGRLPVRRGATVVLGCFILFSAASIADGITSGVSRSAPEPSPVPVAARAAYTPTVPKPVPYDPYAGASVPSQQAGPPVIR